MNSRDFKNVNNPPIKEKSLDIHSFDKILENQNLDSNQQMSNMQQNENLMTQYENPLSFGMLLKQQENPIQSENPTTLQYNSEYLVQVKQQSTKTEHYQYLDHFITRKKILIDKEKKIPCFEQVSKKHIVKNYPNYLFNLVSVCDQLKPELNKFLKDKDDNWHLFCDFNQPIKITELKNINLNYVNLEKCNQEVWTEQLKVVKQKLEAINTKLGNQQNIGQEQRKKLEGQHQKLKKKQEELEKKQKTIEELGSHLKIFNEKAGLTNKIQRNETFDDFNIKITEIEKKCTEHQTPEKMDSQLLQHINALKEYVDIVKYLKDNKLMKKIIDINKSDIQNLIKSNTQTFYIQSKIVVDGIKCDSKNEETKEKYQSFCNKVKKILDSNSSMQSKQDKKEMKQSQKLKGNLKIQGNYQYDQPDDNYVVQSQNEDSQQYSQQFMTEFSKGEFLNSVIIQEQ